MSHDTCHWQLPSVFPLTGLAPPPHLLEQLVLSVAHKHVQLAVHSCLVNCGFEILRHAFQACHSNRNMHQQLEDSH